MIEYIFVIIFGLLLGSFLNVCIYRIPKKQSISYPPSNCQSCNTRLRAWDLVPVFSYLMLRGKCRYCGAPVSIRYPIVELLNPALYVLVYWKFGFSVEGLSYALLFSILVVISYIDYDHKIIPDGLNIAIALLWVLYSGARFATGENLYFMDSALGFIIGGGFYLLVALITAGAMGGGDIKFMAVLGLFLGVKYSLLSIFLTFIIGGVVSVALIALKLKGRKDEIPFGPFIAGASALVMLYGDELLELYFKMIM
ncbi:type 4 prepilin-like protein leader peptide-processing enzyme [Andreesenia angusta]|uniref:Type 4 prepilin-like protein leader peptide-processing enzyme n=1 Tax=Andreesenia angusta TaxID=39480 RepID=A0A1S1V7V5_9FIRM|nr:A24 family peptidase [Andreesenia angusta]OHW62691.1 type 4 prepilin-like protein leader peptide-processing enzyme [Andreesenia angusta]